MNSFYMQKNFAVFDKVVYNLIDILLWINSKLAEG